MADLGTRLLLVFLVKHVNSSLTPNKTKGEIGEKSFVVLLKSFIDMAYDGFAFNEGPRVLFLFYFTPVQKQFLFQIEV